MARVFNLKSSFVTHRNNLLLYPRSFFDRGQRGVWIDPSDTPNTFQDKQTSIQSGQPGQSIGSIRDKSGNGNILIGSDLVFSRVPNPAIFNNKVTSSAFIVMDDLGSNCTVAYSDESGIVINENQTINGVTHLPNSRYLYAYLIIDYQLSNEEKNRLTDYLNNRRLGYVQPEQYSGSLLLENGSPLLSESNTEIMLEGVISWSFVIE